MTPVKFYYDLMFPASRALFAFFKLTKMPVENHPVSMKNGHHLNKDISRLQQLPVIHDEQFQLSETLAILRYLIGKHPVDNFWYPKEPKESIRVDEFINWSAHNMHSLGENSKDPMMSFYRRFQDTALVEPKENEELAKNLSKALDELEEYWTALPFIAGYKLSFADLYAACEVEQAKLLGIDPLASRPKLTAWFQRTQTEFDPYFTEAHKDLYSALK